MMPDLSSALVHSTLPVLGSKAIKCPSVLPLNIRPPAVVSVAPAQGIWVSCCQTCLPVFRSTACTDPQLGVVGSCLTSKDSSRNASPALYATGSAPLMSMQACCVGMYAIWVCGSTEIGHQFFPPRKLGHAKTCLSIVGRMAGSDCATPSLIPIIEVVCTNGSAEINLPFVRSTA